MSREALNVQVEEKKMPGIGWPIKTYRITQKNGGADVLETLRRRLDDTKYKHLDLVGIKFGQDKYNKFF